MKLQISLKINELSEAALFKAAFILILGVMLITLFFLTTYHSWRKQNNSQSRESLIFSHPLSSYSFIFLWTAVLLCYQNLRYFQDDWLIFFHTIDKLLLLITSIYSLHMIFLLTRQFFSEAFNSNPLLKQNYQRLYLISLIISSISAFIFLIYTQDLVQFAFLQTDLWHTIIYFLAMSGSSLITSSFIHFFNKGYTVFWREDTRDMLIFRAFTRPISFAFCSFALWLTNYFFDFSPALSALFGNVSYIFFIIASSYLIYCIAEVLNIYLLNFVSKKRPAINTSLVGLVVMIVKLLVIFGAFLLIAQRLTGQKLQGILAAMGIGGLAFALASQDLLKNLLAGITIMLDKPFILGQTVNALGYDGVIEQIGFRSTSVRTFEGHLITMPNNKLSDSAIRNVSERNFIRQESNISLSYENDVSTLKKSLEIVGEVLSSFRDSFTQEPTWFITEMKDLAINMQIIYLYRFPTDVAGFKQLNQTISLAILTRFEEENVKLTVYTPTIKKGSDS